MAGRYDCWSLGRFYDQQHAQALKALEAVPDEDWQKETVYPAPYPPFNGGPVTVEELFRLPLYHLQAHEADIRQG